MPLVYTDLPTDPDQVEASASDFVDNELDYVAAAVDAVLILGQLDPLEIRDFLPRWTESQREIIVKANDQLREWQE